MQQIIIIGTLHAGWTPADELRAVLAAQKPDQVLVELSPEELERPREDSIRDEMFAAYDWASGKDTPVAVFDHENDVLREGVRGDEDAFREYEQKSREIFRGYTWKQLNREDPWQVPAMQELEQYMNEHYIDPEKATRREAVMLETIRQKMIDGRNVVVTGVGHLPFFSKHLPSAAMPLAGNRSE